MTDESLERSPAVPHLQLKANLLIGAFLALLLGAVLYLMYARGVFEATQRLVLIAEDSEGAQVGMDLTFSGFPIGRVRHIELAPNGNARILVDVPRKDAHWLRETSVFTFVRGLVGGASLRAFTGVLTDPPLPDGAERKVLVGDTAAELPPLVAASRALIENLTQLSAPESALAGVIANVQSLTGKLQGPRGAAGVLLGSDADARNLSSALNKANSLLGRLDGMAAKADTQVLGSDGLIHRSSASVEQLNGLLADARSTLKRVDSVLAEAQAVAGNARVATADLGRLRSEVDATMRKVERLVDEVNRKWPFARDAELKLR